ncbi:MAG TPA: tryptophan--tRNA ligase [Gammaproteobacteria bacterium]|nr:tryptophan--tRNA ligase [Gammaproteobacteria bacterium]
MEIVLTGITTTGTPHIGNYVGAIRPAVAASWREGVGSYYFLADYHSLVKGSNPDQVARSTLEIAASWLAAGLNPKSVFYRQSDVPEITELAWILTCMTAKGLMNRAHAYKAAVDENAARGNRDPDQGITMGLFCYPILMAADILMFKAHKVPVGKDQIQHVEMARDIAARFNHHFGETFVLPEAQVGDASAVLPGLDGRKMLKSYDNTIPLFVDAKKLRKLIMKIKTNSLEPGEPKDPDDSALFAIYRAFATEDEATQMRQRYADGIGWGEMKQLLFEYVNAHLEGPRVEYQRLLAAPDHVEQVLREGAERARGVSRPFLDEIRKAVGIRSLSSLP